MQNNKIRLNKVVKQQLLTTLVTTDNFINIIGKPDLYIIAVKNKKGILFEYKHNKNTDSIVVGKDIVAQDDANNLPQDMQEILNVLSNRIELQRELEQLEKDQKNIKDYEYRALTLLKSRTM